MHLFSLISFDTTFWKKCVFLLGYYWTLPVLKSTCARFWRVAYNLLSFLILWLHLLGRVLVFVFDIFCSNIFLFYFFKLIFWNWNILQIMYQGRRNKNISGNGGKGMGEVSVYQTIIANLVSWLRRSFNWNRL